ncbi:MAG: hypothetical protein QNK20_03075 [Aureibaculum sp.]|nr:hypothetical protein [Aureibaculum sp.]
MKNRYGVFNLRKLSMLLSALFMIPGMSLFKRNKELEISAANESSAMIAKHLMSRELLRIVSNHASCVRYRDTKIDR